MNRRKIGKDREDIAAAYLEHQGVAIRERNYRCQSGEIDLIGRDQEYLVFIEVKYRSSADMGHPEEAVGPSKRRRICRTADYYRYVKRIPQNTAIRYDVIAIEGEQIRWIKNAFPHEYRR
ncbi:MAG: YraN family protein [bacterium]|nr:YraN family protein [bacterium]MCM1376277.1 YraN family protein [Muribaculum sp.]